MGQTANVIFRAEESPHALAHPSARSISSGEQRKPARPPRHARCKARDEKPGHFTPALHRGEVPLKAREVSVYQALEATKRAAEGDDGREKGGK
jgi:hypothetical protein